MKIVWGEFPDGLRQHVEPHVKRYKHLLPAWCERLEVRYDETDTEDYATTSCQYLYREARIDLTPLFWALDLDARAQTIVHEIGHIILAPIDREFDHLCSVVEIEQVVAICRERYSDAVEAVVSDLAHIATR